jgi:uncharacterized protein
LEIYQQQTFKGESMSDTAAPQGLNADELAELEEFLMSDNTPDACMDVSTLDGFLTCILSCPTRPEAEEWINWVWDTEAAEEQPSFDSQAQSDLMYGLIARHAAALEATLKAQSEDYEPVFFYQDEEGEVPALDEWCIGYMIAMADYYEQWHDLLAAKPALFEPIRLFGTEDGQESLNKTLEALNPEEFEERMQAFAGEIRTAALNIFREVHA